MRGIGGWLTLIGVGFLVLLIALPIVGGTFVPFLEDLRTVARTDAGLSCVTNAAGTCTATLTKAHQHYNTEDMTVTETAPGSANRTSITSVGADRVTLTLTGLTALTTYTLTVAYQAQKTNMTNDTRDFLRLLGPVMFLAIFGLFIASGWWAISNFHGHRALLVSLAFVGLLLGLVVGFRIVASFSAGLVTGGGSTGALNLYRMIPFFFALALGTLGLYALAKALR